jgi:hypothetical protein
VELAELVADGQASEEEMLGTAAAIRSGRRASASGLVKEAVQSPPYIAAFNTAITTLRLLAGQSQQSIDQTTSVLLRDIFGNPFRPVPADPNWLSWNDGTIPELAQAVYDDRAFDRLPVLADALEEAGCVNADMLAHCRGPGPHVRGCWVVDLLLGKS